MLGGQPGYLLGERRHDAGRVVADEPADLEYDLDRTAATGQVLKATPVAVVDPCCRLAALRAGHRRRARARHEPDQIAKILHLVQLQAAQAGNSRQVYVEDLDLRLGDEHARVHGKGDTVRTVLLDDRGYLALLKLYLARSGYATGVGAG